MDELKIVYRILSELKEQMGETTDVSRFDHEQFGITEGKWNQIIRFLYKSGYIDGFRMFENIWGDTVIEGNIQITLEGLEYLKENSTMQKMHKAIKGITDLVPQRKENMKKGLPKEWNYMYRYERICWILDNYADDDKEPDEDTGTPQLRDDTPKDVRKAWDEIQKENRENMKKGIMVD